MPAQQRTRTNWTHRVVVAIGLAALIGVSLPSVTQAHWVYTAKGYGTGFEEWVAHSPNYAGFILGLELQGGELGIMYGEVGTNYWIAVHAKCVGSASPQPWKYAYKSAPTGYFNTVSILCANGLDWTQGAISEP